MAEVPDTGGAGCVLAAITGILLAGVLTIARRLEQIVEAIEALK